VDVDGFKTINDSLGRPWGRRAAQADRAPDVRIRERPERASRVVGDALLWCFARIDREDDGRAAHRAAARSVLGTPFRVGEAGLRISARSGLSVS